MRPSRALFATRVSVVLRTLLVLIALLPLVQAALARLPQAGALASALRELYAWQCHQAPERLVQVFGVALPVCARCYGIYFGLGAGALIARPRVPERVLLGWLLVAALLMLLDVSSEYVGLRPAWGALRFATGVGLSYPLGLAVTRLAR